MLAVVWYFLIKKVVVKVLQQPPLLDALCYLLLSQCGLMCWWLSECMKLCNNLVTGHCRSKLCRCSLAHNFAKCWSVFWILHDILSSWFVMKSALTISARLKCVATLPCEIFCMPFLKFWLSVSSGPGFLVCRSDSNCRARVLCVLMKSQQSRMPGRSGCWASGSHALSQRHTFTRHTDSKWRPYWTLVKQTVDTAVRLFAGRCVSTSRLRIGLLSMRLIRVTCCSW